MQLHLRTYEKQEIPQRTEAEKGEYLERWERRPKIMRPVSLTFTPRLIPEGTNEQPVAAKVKKT